MSRQRPRLVVAVGVIAVVLLLAVIGLRGQGANDGDGLSPVAFRDVVLGIDPEALAERMLPVRPLEPVSGEQYGVPPAGEACLHYPAEERGDDVVYRFCFADDRLVDKAVVRSVG